MFTPRSWDEEREGGVEGRVETKAGAWPHRTRQWLGAHRISVLTEQQKDPRALEQPTLYIYHYQEVYAQNTYNPKFEIPLGARHVS
jgi:hypothetical protein